MTYNVFGGTLNFALSIYLSAEPAANNDINNIWCQYVVSSQFCYTTPL